MHSFFLNSSYSFFGVYLLVRYNVFFLRESFFEDKGVVRCVSEKRTIVFLLSDLMNHWSKHPTIIVFFHYQWINHLNLIFILNCFRLLNLFLFTCGWLDWLAKVWFIWWSAFVDTLYIHVLSWFFTKTARYAFFPRGFVFVWLEFSDIVAHIKLNPFRIWQNIFISFG